MQDFYTRKLATMRTIELILQERGRVVLNELVREVNSQTGFSRMVRRFVDDLQLMGKISREFNKDGQVEIIWVQAHNVQASEGKV